MDATLAAVASVFTVVVILAVIHVPLGTWLHRVYTSPRHSRAELLIYRLVGVNPDVEQRWSVYALSVLAFSGVSILALWLLIVVQRFLPWSLGRSMNVDTALNTAVSFVTNTNWQSYAGEAGTGYLVQAAGLTVLSALPVRVSGEFVPPPQLTCAYPADDLLTSTIYLVLRN